MRKPCRRRTSARAAAYPARFVKLTLETGATRGGLAGLVGTGIAVLGFAALTVGLALWNLTVALAVAGVLLMVVGVLLSFAKEPVDVNSGNPFRRDEGSP